MMKLHAEHDIAKNDEVIFRYKQQFNMTVQQNANDFVARCFQNANVCNKGTLNDVIIERMDRTVCHFLPQYWAQIQENTFTEEALQAKFVLFTQ